MNALLYGRKDDMADKKAAASEGKKVDTEAPPNLLIKFETPSGELWGTLTADAKQFSTGSTGFYVSGKVKNPKTGLPYQVGANIILIGSKG
jgi:hypothetical protein